MGINSRATNGKVTKIVAIIMPGTEKMSFTPCSSNHSPRAPLGVKSKTNTNPAITGDTANGSSIRESNTCFPLN